MATATTPDLTAAEIAALEAEPVTAERIRATMVDGGYGRFTVKSKGTGRHVTLVLAAKKRGPDGRVISRATKAGRVGIGEADVVYIDTPEGEWIGRLELGTGTFVTGRNADRNVLWAAQAILATAKGGRDVTEQADVMLAAACSRCHRELRHPESIERGIGPECSGQRTKGRRATAASRVEPLPESPTPPCEACGAATGHRDGCARAEFGF